MSLKVKLITSIASLCMIVCLLSVGVWAASQGTITLNGSVSFTAKDVNVTVVGDASGNKGFDLTNILNEDWNASDATASSTWNPELIFTSHDEIITLTITITNRSYDRKVNVAFAPKINNVDIPIGTTIATASAVGGTNVKAIVTKTATVINEATKSGDTITGTSITLEIQFAVVEGNTSFSGVSLTGSLVLDDPNA